MSDRKESRPGNILTVDDVKHIFPVARSERRKNKDLFDGLLTENELRDDNLFYDALAQLLAKRDFLRICAYDLSLIERKDYKKTFGSRAARWLVNWSAGKLTQRDVWLLPQDHFPAETLASAVHQVLLGLQSEFQAAETSTQDSQQTVASDQTEWSDIARSIAAAANSFQRPDVQAATRLLELAQALVEACREDAEAAEQRMATAQRSLMLRERLASLDSVLLETWPEHVGDEWLQEIDQAVSAGEAANQLVREAEAALAKIDADLQVATNERAYGRLSELGQRAEIAEASVRSARVEHDAALAAIRTLLGVEAGANLKRDDSAQDDLPITDTVVEITGEVESPDGSIEPPVATNLTEIDEAPTAQDIERPVPDPQDFLGPTNTQPIAVETILPPGEAPRPANHLPPVDLEPSPDTISPPHSDRPDFRPDLEALLVRYVEDRELCFAYHLARLAPTSVSVQEQIFRACMVLSAIDRAEDMAEPLRSQTLAELVAALPDAQDAFAAGRLALAALMRPALLDPDHGARDHIGHLRGWPGLEIQSTLIDALSNLGFEVRLSVSQLRDVVDQRAHPIEPEASKRMAAWLNEARLRKTMHQPTYFLFHHELRGDGRIGQIMEAAIARRPGAEKEAQEFIDTHHHNRGAQEAFVRESERQIGRPRRSAIEGMALDWFCRGLEEACDQLASWISARHTDSWSASDTGREKLHRALGPVRKALESAAESVSPASTALARAAGVELLAQLKDMRELLAGRVLSAPPLRPREILELPLNRLPAGCQNLTPNDSDPAFDTERANRDERLLAALSRPEYIAPDTGAAFDARIADKAALPAHRLLEQLRAVGGETNAIRVYQQRLREMTEAARRGARERVARLRQSLSAIGNLDPDASTLLPSELGNLSIIDHALAASQEDDEATIPALNGIRKAELPPDFPQLDVWLGVMETRRDHLRASIGERQRTELEQLKSGAQAASAEALLAAFDSLDPVTVDDAIAELKAGRAVPLPAPDRSDVFTRFYPQFVNALSTNPEETARSRVLRAVSARTSLGDLELGSIDDRRARALKQLLETWAQGENALLQGRSPPLREAIVRLFGLIGFSGVRIGEGKEAIPRRLRLFTMNCDVPRSAGKFIPPVFGSAAAGRYQLLIARSDVAIDQLLRQIGSEAPDAAWIVLFLGRLGVADRARLARQTRSEARGALVLDESLLIFSALEDGDSLSTFLECSLPFAWVQPYTTNAGQIPPESFFGREAEIEQIVSRGSGGCLIYGGRQLGKSVLLNHIRNERHRPDRGELALFIDIKPIGGAGQPSDRIWKDLAHELMRQRDFDRVSGEPRSLVNAIEFWLGHDPSRRLLAMFDEADNFLRAEHASGYPNLLLMKGLMERTGRRFKAVFAGLHNVRRMAHAPNSPLPHLGEPICIGPMNQSPENRAALRRLAVEPMLTAGFDYADPFLVSDMLARMNYYPSLVQVFGWQIVESVGRRPRAGSEGPRWRLDRGDLFDGAAAEKIAQQIRNRFQLTLNLDVRYDCIARSIALHRLESVGRGGDVLAQGMAAAEVLRVTHWPRFLAHPTLADFEELLEELVDLGVLTRFRDSRYGLRNAQVAQLLGRREELEEALLRLDEREDEPSYDAALYFRTLRPHLPEARAPYPDRDVERIFDRSLRGLRLARASTAVVGADFAVRLQIAAGLWLPGQSHLLVKAEDSDIRRGLDRITAGPVVMVIEGEWSPTTAANLARQPKVQTGEVLPVWCCSHSAQPIEGCVPFDACPWSEAMLRHWLADEGLAPALDDVRTRAALLEATGGAPARLEAMRSLLAELGVRPVTERVAEIEAWARRYPFASSSLGLGDEDHACLSVLGDYADQDVTTEELAEICPELTDERLQRLISIGLVRKGRLSGGAPILTALGRLCVP